jgi:hypothetical protein
VTLKSKLAIFKLKFFADLILKFVRLLRRLNMTSCRHMLRYVCFGYVIEMSASERVAKLIRYIWLNLFNSYISLDD